MPILPKLATKKELLIYLLGLYYLFSKTKSLLHFLSPFFYRRPPKSLLNRYGKGSYVLITGGSDGLGKALAFVFAGYGFNLLLISRKEAKLQAVKAEILCKYHDIDVKFIAIDFENSLENSFYEGLLEQIKGIDISILINNVALDYCQEFIKTPSIELKKLLTVNLYPLIFLTKGLLSNMASRKEKSLVLNVSSISGVLPTPYFAVYSATKAFMEALALCLRHELGSKVEFLTFRPNFMSTSMNFNAKSDFETIKPEEAAEGVIRSIGKCGETNGNWRHHFLNSLYEAIDKKVLLWYYMKFMGKSLVERCEKGRLETMN